MNLPTAAARGNLERVRSLVEQGADKEKGDSDGDTPLRLASLHGHLEVAQYLVVTRRMTTKEEKGEFNYVNSEMVIDNYILCL